MDFYILSSYYLWSKRSIQVLKSGSHIWWLNCLLIRLFIWWENLWWVGGSKTLWPSKGIDLVSGEVSGGASGVGDHLPEKKGQFAPNSILGTIQPRKGSICVQNTHSGAARKLCWHYWHKYYHKRYHKQSFQKCASECLGVCVSVWEQLRVILSVDGVQVRVYCILVCKWEYAKVGAFQSGYFESLALQSLISHAVFAFASFCSVRIGSL